MRQLPAIFLLLVLLFNFVGYRLVISFMQQQSTTVLQARADNNEYADDELISIKTTLRLPYYTSSADYERAYGTVVIKGKTYEYVKRRVYKDTLELLCLPNITSTKLAHINNQLADASADGSATLPEKKSSIVLKISLPDFFNAIESFKASVATSIAATFTHNANNFYPDGYAIKPYHPPQEEASLLCC